MPSNGKLSLGSVQLRNWKLGSLIALLLLGVLVACYYFTGLFGSDDLSYVNGAYGLSGGTPEYAILGGARYPVTIPLRFFLEISGSEPQRAVMGFSAIYLLLALVVYVLVVKLYDARTGIFSAFLVVANPIIFVYSGAILPDNILAILFVSSVLLFASWLNGLRLVPTPVPRKDALLFAASALAGGCYATKEASALFFVPIAAYGALAIWRFRSQGASRILLIALSGFLLVVSADALLSSYLYGDPFIRLNVAGKMDVVSAARNIMSHQGIYPWQRVESIWEQFSGLWPAVLVHFVAIFYLMVRCGKIKEFFASPDGVIVAMVVWSFAFLTFGSISLREYVGIPLQARYYAPVAVLLCVCLGRSAADISHRFPSCRGQVLVFGGIVGLVIFQILWPISAAGNIYRAQEYRAAMSAISNTPYGYPGIPIYVDSYLAFRTLGYGNVKGVEVSQGGDLPQRFVYIYSPGHVRRDKELLKLLRCERLAHGVEDATGTLAGVAWKTRFDAIKAELGFIEWAAREPSPKVRALIVESAQACGL